MLAGHGFSAAFTDIEWLPEPGIVPDSPWYPVDAWGEWLRLCVTAAEDRNDQRLDYAREKLAEMKAMIERRDSAAAEIAITHYIDYLTDAASEPAAEQRPLAEALLEHQYIVSVEYTDWPLATRPVATRMIRKAREAYAATTAQLAPAVREALFFKQDEVRWSWEMAELADEQELEN